jgi:hypothetical protein
MLRAETKNPYAATATIYQTTTRDRTINNKITAKKRIHQVEQLGNVYIYNNQYRENKENKCHN